MKLKIFIICNIPHLTHIILISELFSSIIKSSVVVLWDRIHRELGNLINIIRMIKLGWLCLNVKLQVCEQGNCSIGLIGVLVLR